MNNIDKESSFCEQKRNFVTRMIIKNMQPDSVNKINVHIASYKLTIILFDKNVVIDVPDVQLSV